MPDFAGQLAFYWDPIMDMLEDLDVDSFMMKLWYSEGYGDTTMVVGGFIQNVLKGIGPKILKIYTQSFRSVE